MSRLCHGNNRAVDNCPIERRSILANKRKKRPRAGLIALFPSAKPGKHWPRAGSRLGGPGHAAGKATRSELFERL